MTTAAENTGRYSCMGLSTIEVVTGVFLGNIDNFTQRDDDRHSDVIKAHLAQFAVMQDGES